MFFYLAIVFLAVTESNSQSSPTTVATPDNSVASSGITFSTEETCLTISKTQGNCVNINGCPSLLRHLMKPRPLSADTINILTKSQCGFEGNMPKVCCPLNSEPDSTAFPDVTNHPNLRLLDYRTCGPYSESKIFGGNKTGVFEFPWMALISYNVGKPEPEFKCGGSLISKRYVLTAAHCVAQLERGDTLRGVRLGEHDLSKERDCDVTVDEEVVCSDGYQDFLAESVHVHPEYSRQKLRNDIALIRLNKDADIRANVRPICLPLGSAATLVNKKVVISGWGTTESGFRSEDLLKVKLPTVPIDQCTRVYKMHKVDLWYKQLCAGGSNRMDSCAGDSGGPMQSPAVYSDQVKTFQYGVVSFGPKPCAIEGFPGVYTSVPYYMDWILNNMSD